MTFLFQPTKSGFVKERNLIPKSLPQFRLLWYNSDPHCGYSGSELIFVTNITNYIRGEKIVIWRNFGYILGNLGNFCRNLGAFMWRKIEPKSTFVEKK